MNQPTVIVTGANGFVGKELVGACSAAGWKVRALVRDITGQPALPGVTYHIYDLTQVPDPVVFKGADYLVHAAYIKEDRAHPNAFDQNIEGSKQLLAASRAHKLQKTLFISSMSAHKDAVSTYGKQKFALEKLFSGKGDCVIRSGLVIGNGGLIRQITQFMRTKHVAPLIDGGNQPLQVIAVADLVRAIQLVLTGPHQGLFTLGTPEVYSYREFYLMLRRKLGIQAWIIPVPFWMPLFAIRLISWLHLPLGITEDNLWGLKKLQAFETLPDLQRLDLQLDPLDRILDNLAHDSNRI